MQVVSSMTYQFSNLIETSEMQEILDSFYSVHGITTEILDLNDQILVTTSVNNICDEFPHDWYQSQPDTWQSKDDVDCQVDKATTKTCSCLGVVFKYARDIRVENRQIATLILGPVLLAPPDDDSIRLMAEEHGFDEAAYRKAVRETPVVSDEQAESYLAFLTLLIQRLAEKGLNQLRTAETLKATKEDLEKLQKSFSDLEARIQEGTYELEMTNTALQESEQRFRVALMDTPVIVFNQDLDLRYTWVYNPQNYAEQPIVGKTDAELFSAEDAERFSALKRRVIAAGLLTREEVSVTVGPRTNFYDMTLDPLYDADGTVVGLTCAATDITDRKHIEDQLRRMLAESEGIQKIAKGLLQKTSLDEVLEIVCTEAMHLTGAEGSVVLLLDQEGWLRLTHRVGSPVYTLDRLPVEGSFAGRAVQTEKPVWINKGGSHSVDAIDSGQNYPWTPGLRSMLSVPLKVDKQVIGVLNILDKPGDISQEDIRIISLFADQASIIIEHARLQQRAEQVAVLEERQHLARELHDSVTQALYSVTLYADAARMAFTAKKWEALDRNLQEVRKMAREAMYDMRLLVFELHPFLLEKEGLASALRARLAAVEGRAGLKTEVLVEGERRLPIEIEEGIYRIAQEGLNNVVKHAKATEVRVRIQYGEDTIWLEMIDDGVGFDIQTANESGGMGLTGIRERVQQLGGNLEVESNTGKGTHMTVRIPIE